MKCKGEAPVVAVDLDGVIFDFVAWFERHLDNPQVVNRHTYFLDERYGIDRDKVTSIFESHPWDDMELCSESREAIHAIAHGIEETMGTCPEIVILTDTIKSKHQDRIKALEAADIFFDRIVFTNGNKKEWIKKFQPQVLFDDRLDYVQYANKEGTGVLVDYYGIFEQSRGDGLFIYARTLMQGVNKYLDALSASVEWRR